jgi:thiol peroxidase
MEQRDGIVTFKGKPMTLLGPDLREGTTAPGFTVMGMDLKPVGLSDYAGQVIVISAVPSVDTPICETQTRRFDQEAGRLKGQVLTISMDLPFAQKRFVESHGIRNISLVSDFKDKDFATKYGLLIKELGLIARSVFVINKEGLIVYRQIVDEMTREPNYEPALAAAREAGA